VACITGWISKHERRNEHLEEKVNYKTGILSVPLLSSHDSQYTEYRIGIIRGCFLISMVKNFAFCNFTEADGALKA
jgi:hypothetical protein